MKKIMKLSKKDIMKDKTRIDIVALIRINPGSSYCVILDSLKLPKGRLTHHIKVLESKKIIKSIRAKQFKKFYLYEYKGKGFNNLTVIEEIIVEIVEDGGPLRQVDIYDNSPIDQSTLSRRLHSLVSEGVLEIVALEGGHVGYGIAK